MKLSLETGVMELWVLAPFPSIIYDSGEIELGVFFLKFYLTIKIKTK